MRYLAADNARTVLRHKRIPVRKLRKLTALSSAFRPGPVPVISVRAVEAPDGDEQDTHQTGTKPLHR